MLWSSIQNLSLSCLWPSLCLPPLSWMSYHLFVVGCLWPCVSTFNIFELLWVAMASRIGDPSHICVINSMFESLCLVLRYTQSIFSCLFGFEVLVNSFATDFLLLAFCVLVISSFLGILYGMVGGVSSTKWTMSCAWLVWNQMLWWCWCGVKICNELPPCTSDMVLQFHV